MGVQVRNRAKGNERTTQTHKQAHSEKKTGMGMVYNIPVGDLQDRGTGKGLLHSNQVAGRPRGKTNETRTKKTKYPVRVQKKKTVKKTKLQKYNNT